MDKMINQLDAGFVLAVILFLFFFFAGAVAGICDVIKRKRDERKKREFYARYEQPIGKLTDYRVVAGGYQPWRIVDGPLNPPTGGSGVQRPKSLTPRGCDKAKGKR